MTPCQALLGFRGRIARPTFAICSMLAVPLYAIALVGVMLVAWDERWSGSGRDLGLYAVGMTLIVAALAAAHWILLALAIKRLHDFGRSGLHVLWLAVIIVAAGIPLGVLDLLRDLAAPVVVVVAVGFWLGLALVPGQRAASTHGSAPA